MWKTERFSETGHLADWTGPDAPRA
jgi:hypothetical protein